MAEKGYNLRPNRKNSNLNPNYDYDYNNTDSESEIEEEGRHRDDITRTQQNTQNKKHIHSKHHNTQRMKATSPWTNQTLVFPFLQIEINSIKITQTTQAEEIIKLNEKLTQKIDESQDQMRQFVIDNLTQQQLISDNKNQQRQNDILSAVKTQLVMHEQNFDQKIEELSQRTRQESEQNSKANLTIIQNEILPKLTIQNKTLESQQAEIQSLNQNLTKCEQEVETLKQSKTFEKFQGPIKIICNGNEEKDRQIPKFNGRSGNPKEYLNKLKRYYDRGLERNSNYDPIEYLKDLLETSFEGPASRWLQLVKTDLSSWEQFSNEFEAKYWSREVQRSLRAKIESEKYRSNGTLSRSEYLTERVISLQSMSPCLTEEEIVTLMAEIFDSIVQDCINVQNITTVRALERLLQREDLKDGPKKTRTNNQNHNSSSNNRPTTPNQQPHTYKSYPNHQNYRPNHNHPTYDRNHENKPYQRDKYPPRNGDNNQRTYRNHPTQEQAQLCAVMRQNNYVPSAPPNNQSSHSYEPQTHPAPNIQENGSAL
ncbi:putative uncharacterized protein DDB_G0279653 [Macrosteles quadrilineatus]|uniref:putative uncharacterized protein DDB_G0279653 n=1 Tax=Macrosteles quadrilineatus TaxID=74068 RepID=UPI0023E0D600|nr:putative uncharacterized protein DDB_G0279653 [Macrosteles quadrilineatus]